MQIKYSIHLAELTFDAILKVFNRKKTFLRFLRSMGINDNIYLDLTQMKLNVNF